MKGLVAVLALVAVISTGVAAYFWEQGRELRLERQRLEQEHRALLQRAQATQDSLDRVLGWHREQLDQRLRGLDSLARMERGKLRRFLESKGARTRSYVDSLQVATDSTQIRRLESILLGLTCMDVQVPRDVWNIVAGGAQ